jgi:hypothetical protein
MKKLDLLRFMTRLWWPTADELAAHARTSREDASMALLRASRQGLVERDQDGPPYRYQITDRGLERLDYYTGVTWNPPTPDTVGNPTYSLPSPAPAPSEPAPPPTVICSRCGAPWPGGIPGSPHFCGGVFGLPGYCQRCAQFLVVPPPYTHHSCGWPFVPVNA